MKHELTNEECKTIVIGEAISLAAVMAICAVAITAVIIYKLFLSSEGSTTIPGGWKFSWK
ncbi:MAG TPA: hypothetical protein DDW20_03140 [Firmicutes bacterium]|nr:hypothetical protein [Bacillota bacterium]